MIDGPTLLAEALAAGCAVDEVFVDVERLDGPIAELLDRAEAVGAEVFGVTPDVLRRVSDPVQPQAVTAVAKRRPVTGDALATPLPVLALIGLADPGNAGTLVRGAVAAGFGAVAVTPGTVELLGPKALRASAGAVFRLPIVEIAAIEELRPTHTTVATTLDASLPYDRADLTGPVAVLIGNEAHGLDPEVAAAADVQVTIPMVGPTESLNAAMAGTVLCFEIVRQRRQEAS